MNVSLKSLKRNKPELTVTASLYVDHKKSSGILSLLAHFLLILAGAYGSAFSFLTCFDLGFSNAEIFFWTVLFCALLTVVFSLTDTAYRFCAGTTAGIFLLAAFAARYQIAAGFFNIANIYLAEARQVFRDNPFAPIAYPEEAANDMRVFVLFVVFLITLSLACAIAGRKKSLIIALPITVIPVELCFFFGFVPHYSAFIALVASWAGIIALDASVPDSSSSHTYKKASAQCGFAAAALMTLCFIIVQMYINLSGYERPAEVYSFGDDVFSYVENTTLQNALSDLAAINPLNSLGANRGAIDHGRLGRNGSVSFSNRPVLSVTIPKSEDTIYFRGFVGSVYNGQSWSELSNAKLTELSAISNNSVSEMSDIFLLESYNLKLLNAALPEHDFSVRNISASRDYLYMPYNLVPEAVSAYHIVNHSHFSSQSWGFNYSAVFYDPAEYGGWYKSIPSRGWSIYNRELAQDEATYRLFVYDNYLTLPDGFTAADRVFTDEYYNFVSYEGEMEAAVSREEALQRKLYYIRRWLRDNCQYDLNAGKLPDGRDFIDYFINENQRGSCSHFASSAVMLCRYAGIPARYVEGYIIKPNDFSADLGLGFSETVSVTDARGHAWVEVYIDGFGWYPIEFTPGYGNVQTAVTTSPSSEPETETTSESLTEESTETTTEQSTESETEEQAPEETAEDEEVSEASEEKSFAETESPLGSEEEDNSTSPLKAVLSFAAAVLLLISLLLLRRYCILKKYAKSVLSGADTNAAALCVYNKLMLLSHALKLEEQGTLTYSEYAKKLADSPYLDEAAALAVTSTALKAAFDCKPVPRDEVLEAYNLVNASAAKLYDESNGFKRLYLKYALCLI
ncbi:MAG: transglutaminase-like domain-containing protein [Oscillospiraceae bacterium]|nr:transglutaminase-like domain-containing protein [Oscillospiraceae bacterium]